MKSTIALALVMVAASKAVAQEIAPAQLYTLTLSAGDLQVIVAALGDMPMKAALPTYDKIRQQIARIEQERREEKKALNGKDLAPPLGPLDKPREQ